MKIAVVSHVNSYTEFYSVSMAIKHQVELLRKYGHDVTRIKGHDMVRWARKKNVVNEEVKKQLVEFFNTELPQYDVVITHDFYLDDCITYQEAIQEASPDIPWIHFQRSLCTSKRDWDMPNSLYVAINKSNRENIAINRNVPLEKVKTLYNVKTPQTFFNFEEQTKDIIEEMRLWERDIIMTYPICGSRMLSKGINEVIKVFNALGEKKKCTLIVCNPNWNKPDRIELVEKLLEDVKNFDIKFTREVPSKVVAELQLISNLFVFATLHETCGNAMLEASLGRNLLVINDNVPVLKDFVDLNSVITTNFQNLDNELEPLIKYIIDFLNNDRADKQMRHVWRNHHEETIYNQLMTIINEHPTTRT